MMLIGVSKRLREYSKVVIFYILAEEKSIKRLLVYSLQRLSKTGVPIAD